MALSIGKVFQAHGAPRPEDFQNHSYTAMYATRKKKTWQNRKPGETAMILTNKEALDRLGDGAHLEYARLQHIAGALSVKKSGKRTELVQRIQAKLATLPPGEASGFSDEIIPVAAAAPRTAESDEIRAPEEKGLREKVRGYFTVEWMKSHMFTTVFVALGLLAFIWAVAQAFRGETPMEVFSQQPVIEQIIVTATVDVSRLSCKVYRTDVNPADGVTYVTAVNPQPFWNQELQAADCYYTAICPIKETDFPAAVAAGKVIFTTDAPGGVCPS